MAVYIAFSCISQSTQPVALNGLLDFFFCIHHKGPIYLAGSCKGLAANNMAFTPYIKIRFNPLRLRILKIVPYRLPSN
jgi:hypothetical protein